MNRTSDPTLRAPLRLVAVLVGGLLAATSFSSPGGAATATVASPPAAGPTPGSAAGLPTPSIPTANCPWLAKSMAAGDSPAQLARKVVERMTLADKLGEIVLNTSQSYENVNAGVARLCIPSLTLSDGPWGLAFGDTGVSQLPVPLAVGATFDTALATQYGEVMGEEARGQGIHVSQGPNLNIDRVPTSGRADESYGEDPLLTTQLGLADIRGMQSRGVMANAKHLAAYSQETNRGALNAVVPTRALQEIYLPPFKAAVTQGHVASLMCAYPRLDGTFQCQDPALGLILSQWGFAGFVRSDLGAVHNQAAALGSGVHQLKPSSIDHLGDLVASHRLSVATVDGDVKRILTAMFAYGIVGRPSGGTPGSPVNVPCHTQFALSAAERSAVLLQNHANLLPLTPGRIGSIAVIGADASTHVVTQGFGSSHVVPPFTSLPLDAIRTRFGPTTSVRYEEGGSTTKHLASIPTKYLTPVSGRGHGLTLTVGPPTGSGPSVTTLDPLAAAAIVPAPQPTTPDTDQVHANPPAEKPTKVPLVDGDGERLPEIDPTTARATNVQIPTSWHGSRVSWAGAFTPPRSGRYVFSLAGTGAASLTLDGKSAVADMVTHDTGTWSGSILLTAGHHYRLSLRWMPVADAPSLAIPSILDLGMAYVGDAVAQAVGAARASDVAVVFAADFSAETFDRPNLSLPGDQDALIAAVAAANPRTVVVLNTGGPIVMPWLPKVAAVVEAWYPGEQDGAAIAAVLAGDVNPSGHLPVTFPSSMAKSAVPARAQWPGVGLTSNYSEGLLVGYRFNHATGTKPLFPFGFGLSYTSFSFHRATVVRLGTSYAVSVVVTNTGQRAGSDVAQAYITHPQAAHEPPGQLAAFATVTLAPGESRVVTFTVRREQLRTFQAHGWATVHGTYRIAVGDSSANLPAGTPISVS